MPINRLPKDEPNTWLPQPQSQQNITSGFAMCPLYNDFGQPMNITPQQIWIYQAAFAKAAAENAAQEKEFEGDTSLN